MAAVDRLLLLLPDRHRLIDGTGLDLYRDFDSLLIATPNPTDDAVTFLAARHHLMECPIQGGPQSRSQGGEKAHRLADHRRTPGRNPPTRQGRRGTRS
jgi:hypothetical protein